MRVALVRLENTGEYQTKDKRYLVERLEGRNKYLNYRKFIQVERNFLWVNLQRYGKLEII